MLILSGELRIWFRAGRFFLWTEKDDSLSVGVRGGMHGEHK